MKIDMKLAGSVLAAFVFAALASAAPYEDLDLYQWSIQGTKVNATAAQLNQLATGDLTVNDATIRTNVIVGGNANVAGTLTSTGAITGPIDADNLTGNIAVARLTNAVGVSAATITITNYGVGDKYGTNVITFFGTVSYP